MRVRSAFAWTASLLAVALMACGNAKTRGNPATDDVGIAATDDAGAMIDASVDAGDDAGVDAGVPDDAGVDAGLIIDAGFDAGMPVDAGPMCPAPPMFDYVCDSHDTSGTCPMGFCIASLCVAPQVDPHQWDSCGDGTCDPCETADTCPADCGVAPVLTGTKSYDDGTTMTVWLHGFINAGAHLDTTVYGDIRGCGNIGDAYAAFGVDAPCGDTAAGAMAPNQTDGVEYYGEVPPTWMTPQEVADVEQYPPQDSSKSLMRYATIVGKFIRHQMAVTGATHVNLGCHSMGCLVSRYLIENDVEQLASQNVIVRWLTGSGVVAGAQLARLYDNPTVQQSAKAIGLQLSDFVIMNPDYVQAYAATWDHKLYEGNNPLYSGMLITQVGATNPHIDQAAGIQLLDLYNPKDNPNDGIMFTADEYFTSQSPAASVTTPSGEVVSATHTFIYEEHDDMPSSIEFQTVAAAAMTGRRKVFVSLTSIEMDLDREFNLDGELGEQGLAPAEVVVESWVNYDPYTQATFGLHTPVQDDEIAYRSPTLFNQRQNTTLTPNQVFFEAPVFDAQQAFHLKVQITEADSYPRWGVNEAVLNANRALGNYEADVTLEDQMIPVTTKYIKATLQVHVVNLY